MAIKVEEKSLQLALVKAAGQLGITQDELGYKVINKSSGFLGVFGKKVAIEVWKKGQGRAGGSSRFRDNSEEDKAVLSPKEIKELMESLRSFCQGICSRMVDEDVEVTAELDDERLILNIENDYLAGQMTRNSRFAEALEHILRKKPRHIRQELPFRIFIDVKGMRRGRETELVDMAQDLSNKVHENKRPIVLNYRSSYDRKIIHMALDKDSRVYTKSIGSGPNRKLMILPSKSDGREANQ
ncbi:MAG: R3H domain-containing nucleic acid-binding protein [Oligoflexales bacterium]